MDSHDGHNSPHPKTSYGIDGGGPKVTGEEEGHDNGDKEQTLSATVQLLHISLRAHKALYYDRQSITYGNGLETVAAIDPGISTDPASVTAPLACD